MAGYVCHAHFGFPKDKTFEQQDAEEAACADCQAAKKAARDRIQRENTIDPNRPYGQHIGLICTVCSRKFSTKNIDYIGARSIFRSPSEPDDCTHSINDLQVAATS